MLEFLGTGLLGSLFGGLFRLAPEILKFFDKRNERSHELKMFTLQTDLEKLRGEFKVEEKYVDHSIAQLDAIKEAFKEQNSAAENSYKWVSALSALVRPMITYVIFGLYIAYKLCILVVGLSGGATWSQVVMSAWTAEDFALLNMILTFWYVGRSIEKYEKSK